MNGGICNHDFREIDFMCRRCGLTEYWVCGGRTPQVRPKLTWGDILAALGPSKGQQGNAQPQASHKYSMKEEPNG